VHDGTGADSAFGAAVRGVYRALHEASDRADFEATVCQVLDAAGYPAWIGAFDEADGVVPRAAAGIDEEALVDGPVMLDDPAPHHRVTATAVRTGSVQTATDGWPGLDAESPESGLDAESPERESATERTAGERYEASAAVPIPADGPVAVLTLYGDRAGAFDDESLLAELGDTVGAAMANRSERDDLAASKRTYERLVERVSDAYHAVDDEWRITYWNEQIAQRTETPAATAVGEVFWEVFPDLVGTDLETQYREAMAGQESRSFETYLDEPFDYWVEVDLYPDEDGLSIFSRDVTERVARERELRETANTLQTIIEVSPDPITMLGAESEVMMWNPAAEEIFGWEREEVLGEPAPYIPEERREEYEGFIENLNQGQPNRFVETVREAKDGEGVDVILSSATVETDGDFTGYVGFFKDIRQRKEYERRLQEQRDSLDVLNQVVRHDIRNDLQVVSASAERLKGEVDGESQAALDRILGSIESAVELTNTAGDLADVMLGTPEESERIPLRSTLESGISEVRSAYSDASVTVEGEIPPVSVCADEMLPSVFRNLLKNAVQHNDRDRPEVTVSVDAGDDAVSVRVADDGPGVPDERKDEIFGRGEKGLESRGTGIGLFLVRELVESHGGTVRVEDNDPRGAVFVVELPRAD